MFCPSLRVYLTTGTLSRGGLVRSVLPLPVMQNVIPRSSVYICVRQKQRTTRTFTAIKKDVLK